MEFKCLICGMIINTNNFNLNREAFTQDNLFKDNQIKYCPFCGASYEYIGNTEDKLLTEIKGLDEKTLNILDHAMKLETFNGDFYKNASRIAKDKSNKDKFKALSNVEYTHARIHGIMGGFHGIPKLNEINYDRYNEDIILISQAEKRETHAINFYRKYYEHVCSDIVRNVFDILSNVEKLHIELIKN